MRWRCSQVAPDCSLQTVRRGAFPQRGNAAGLPPLWVQRDMALTTPHYVQRPMHPDRGSSWVLPQKKSSNILMYVEDADTDDEYFYDYPSGRQSGYITGIGGVEGGCVDAKGDVYFAEFDGGTLVEYAHGGTRSINTYNSGGTPIGLFGRFKGDVRLPASIRAKSRFTRRAIPRTARPIAARTARTSGRWATTTKII